MMKSRIYYTKPSITQLEVEYATDAARNGWGDRYYEFIMIPLAEVIKGYLKCNNVDFMG